METCMGMELQVVLILTLVLSELLLASRYDRSTSGESAPTLYTSDWRLDGTWRRSGPGGKMKNPSPCWKSNTNLLPYTHSV
jgi:hypothetical protein